MSYRADFLDGPMQYTDLAMMGPTTPFADLYATPNPTDADAPWIIVGYTGLEPEQPWPSQVHYELVATTEVDGEVVAKYALPLDRNGGR